MSDKPVPAEEESLIEYPCDFAVKVMGAALPEFHQRVEQIAKTHDPEFDSEKIRISHSRTGKYVSLTLTIHAKSKPQLDALYQDLTACELVLWVL